MKGEKKMEKVEPKTLAGFMELLPEEQVIFNHMKDVIRVSNGKKPNFS